MSARIVITGSAGLIGTVLTARLRQRHTVIGLDRAARRGSGQHRVDMAKAKHIESLFAGCDTVVDLAGLADPRASWRDIWANNLPAAISALEAAARAGVR